MYVATRGVYAGVPDVDPWDELRDARTYRGPHPVVAHPPCGRWGKLAALNESRHGALVGNDRGCFAAALRAVRRFGGVLEHPAFSRAYRMHSLRGPPASGGWVPCDAYGGFACHVEQGHYGHRARKATWLYAIGCNLPDLQWGPSETALWCIAGANLEVSRGKLVKTMSKRERRATPAAFRDLLLSIARTARPLERLACPA